MGLFIKSVTLAHSNEWFGEDRAIIEAMRLQRLLESINKYDIEGDMDPLIEGIAYDSRMIHEGDLFVAIKGNSSDGHDFIYDAVNRGAAAVIGENFPSSHYDVPKVRVSDSREALSKISARFYGDPCRGMTIIGVTGTNGKTTVTYIIESILTAAGFSPGVIGTVNCRFKGKTMRSPVTTPESLDLMRIMREMADAGITHVVLEISSHALVQKRTGDCPVNVAIFTNLSRDHLDYHKSMDEYFKAKSLLFRGLDESRERGKSKAVINIDDPRGRSLLSLSSGELLTYGISGDSSVTVKSPSFKDTGIDGTLVAPQGERRIKSSLIGMINIYNILAASAAALALGIDLDNIAEGIEKSKPVPGRLEAVKNSSGLKIIVDYAHTPDALLKAQESLRSMVHGRLITLFGCGGDRDRGKRHEMGKVAGENSDIVIITSDNPRTEDPFSIVREIEKGVISTGIKKAEWPAVCSRIEEPVYFVEVDRRKAIRIAVSLADPRDLILIAGKGHEDYQIIGSEKRPFDDRKEATLAAEERWS